MKEEPIEQVNEEKEKEEVKDSEATPAVSGEKEEQVSDTNSEKNESGKNDSGKDDSESEMS